jgi:hypothetical protein
MGRIVFLVLLVIGIPAAAQRDGEASALAAFASRAGIAETAAFVETVQSLRAERRLPSRYVRKPEARAAGWHGGGLCSILPGRVIGGDAFNNFGGQLPAAPGRRYREADLDPTCRERGAKRLIFSNDGLIFVTTDHYRTFTRVP